MTKGKYFLKSLMKAIKSEKMFVDGESVSLSDISLDGNLVQHSEGSFTCEVIKLEVIGKSIIAHLYTKVDEKLTKKASKKVTKKASKKVTKKATKKV